jgi:phospholipid-transporting ATPase
VVNIIREKETSERYLTTLAIGDGANDVNMITAAHIGVGISGLEGQQAARAADYSIGQFKFLKNLMFTHGREAYRRNSYLILYMFYKNVIYVLPIFFYGYYTAFSGTQFYDIYMYQVYNILFTGMPVCWFCTFDWEHTKETLLANP